VLDELIQTSGHRDSGDGAAEQGRETKPAKKVAPGKSKAKAKEKKRHG
jgi:hypothetical protein